MSLFTPLTRARAALRNREEPENMRYIARAFWISSLTCIGVLVLLSIMFGIEEFYSVVHPPASVAGSAASSATGTLTKAHVDAVVDAFTARGSAYAEFKSAPPAFIDPSH